MTEGEVRCLSLGDLERLAALERQQPRHWSAGQLQAALEDRDCCVLGIEVESALIGHAVVARLPFEAELQAMLVAPAMRRRGLAAALLEAVVEQCRRWGSERLLLEVRAGNVAAIALYRRAGFSEDGRRRGYYPPLDEAADAAREDALLMSRRL
ncbi:MULTISPECIES: ribosomal protein S18-alanine N-acetyltransferase [Halomonadaceae]|jgi:ribosomal-protein-alanine N-acetyltransferase|uniref:[Ribosomal protein bS18]-alanine N-acetyltransferase n=1 Tax=Billgrantia aerodenitrificans TaxID=2733483 RepID=A0ABS9AL89_9GAMM|nr:MULTISPECIES: ribosomal protein S18-alanine N-acetyltransferase [Halomonas]MCE8022573.1 ribosomal protein S18-alanine N-acetyltransferase [Halomonas aerodenitrificans]MCE8038026.1 ribosomal protein S18-alanine N-acetyltransferase [Halomonas sp. MCCC 1A11062]